MQHSSRSFVRGVWGKAYSAGQHWADHPPHPLQAIVISEAFYYACPGWKGGALQMQAVRTKEKERVLQWVTFYVVICARLIITKQ